MANETPMINYTNRDFESIRRDLITYVKNYHSDKFQFFNDASSDMLYLDLLAYMGDTLNFSLDRSFNESFRLTAQSRESLIRMAQDQGFYNYYPKPSTTQATISISVPAIPNEDGSAMIPDPKYLLSIYSGLKARASNGSIFECLDEINFANDNLRSIVPNLDTNNILIDYTINKQIRLVAGETKVQRYYVNENNSKPFMEIYIEDTNVTEIIGIVPVVGNVFDAPEDSYFRDINNMYVEVENLAEDKIFVNINPMPEQFQSLVNLYTDMSINYGTWINKPKRFIVRRDKLNRTKVTFGSTLVNYDYWNQLIGSVNINDLANFSINQILNNTALGEIPQIGNTLFIKYRAGAGVNTNILNNEISEIIDKQFSNYTQVADFGILDRVRGSLKISSNLPAIGGTDEMTNEELRHSIGKVFSTNDRGVTYEDIKNIILKMPAQFGQPFRISYEELKPKVLNYNQVNNYVSLKLDEILALNIHTERENKVFEIKQFLNSLPAQTATILQDGITFDLATSSNQILQNTPSLWIGEKCRLYVLGIDQDYQPTSLFKDSNGVWRSKNQLLKENIKNFLIQKRVIGDWIDLVDANVINFQVEFKIMADKKNKQKVLIDCLTRLRDYFNIYNWQINQPIFISNVQTILQEIDGVINVIDIKFYNIFGKDLSSNKEYSPIEIGKYYNNSTIPANTQNNKFQMNTINNVILSRPADFLSVRYPQDDIIGYVI